MQVITWVELFKFVGGGAALLAVAAWLIRSLTLQLLSRDIEKYKFNLKRESDKEIEILKFSLVKEVETLKSSLSMEALTHQIRFSKLHERRAKSIEELYHKVIQLETLALRLTLEMDDDDHEELQVRADEFIDKFLETNSLLQENAIYFPSKIIEKIAGFNNLMFDLSLNLHYHSKSENAKDFIDAFKNKQKAFETQNSDIKRFVESEFRALLGVMG
ncbi:hypothetical protein C7B65_11995 [Phormidesmis priestleyi ULC007]|uniref:Uncharacterized protein n=1 Tax=Phormidesmis priestleyi ULC007 TaxID=1920490 RepID=A0A2T1DFL9_9CYAN|nr:hypothetical protein [Phormidesmis priestleyi]PSB19288.1 hypothetical protein C7B65_11995 [Phormidesmis priestleyi ULC007]PZO52173.1 MAG: hypothetical protein DCF14_06780 [Phormidesmis priestleyi]